MSEEDWYTLDGMLTVLREIGLLESYYSSMLSIRLHMQVLKGEEVWYGKTNDA